MPKFNAIKNHQTLIKSLQDFIVTLVAALLLSLFTSGIALALTADNQSNIIKSAPTVIQGENDTLVIGSEQDYPPFSTGLTDATAGGFTVELWKAVAHEMGLKYSLRVRPFNDLLNEFKAGKIDVLINLNIVDELNSYADFSVPHAIVQGGIFVRESDSNIRSQADFSGKSIIMIAADVEDKYAKSIKLGKQLILVKKAEDGLRLLASGKHDAMLLSKVVGIQILQDKNITNIKLLKENAGFTQKFAFAVHEGHSELLSKINEGLALSKANGTYDALYEKWFGIYEAKTLGLRDMLKYLAPLLILFLGLAQYGIYRRNMERNAAQKALHESEAHLRLSQISGGIGTWEADLVNHAQKWSENCTALLGFTTPKNPTWDDFISLVHPQDRQTIIDVTQLHIEHGTPYDVEYRIITPAGECRWVRSTGQVERDATGKPIIMRGIAQDIQVRKLAEQALQKSEHTLSEVLENVDSYIYLKDIQGRYLYANAKVCQLFGTTIEAIVGRGDEQFFDAETTEKIRVNDNQVLLEGKIVRAEETNLTIKHGVPTTYLSVKLPLRNDAGEIYALCGISTEITDIKLLEIQLFKNNSLLQSTLESTNDAILVVDLNNTWMLHNQKFVDLWQINDDVIKNKDDGAALSSVLEQLVDADTFISKVRELYSSPEASSFDTLKFKNGKIVERYSIPQFAEGKVVGRVWSFRDVTERKHSEDMLQKSEARLASLFSNMTNGFALHEVIRNTSGQVIDYRFLEVNPAFETMTGISREQWIGQRVKEVLPSIEEDFWIDSYAQVVNTGEAATFEKYSHELGLWFRVYAYRPVAEHFAVIVEDITERKLAEEKLIKSEGFSRAIIEASSVPFALNDDAGNITYLNKAFVEIFGYNRSDIPTLADWWPLAYPDPEYRQQIFDNWQNNMEEAQRTKTPFEPLEINIQCKDGSLRTTICSAADLEGDFFGSHLVSLVDITERKKTEHALIESELRWKFAIEGAGDGVWDWNPITDEAHFSKRWKEVIGYSEHEFPNVGAAWVAHLHPDDKDRVLSAIGEYIAGERPSYEAEFRMRCKDDSYVWILARGMVVSRDVNGAPTQIIGTHHDITSRKNEQIELIQKQAELTSSQAQLMAQNENLLKLQIILQETRDRYIDLYEFAPIGYLAISNHGMISEINWKATGFFGLHRNELNGHRFEEFVADNEKQRWQRMFSSTRNLISGEDTNFDLKITHKDGSILDVNLTCLRMDDADDEPMLRISMVNVSQLKIVESKLISSEAYLRNIIDNEPESIKIVDAKGNLKQINPSGLAMLEAKTFEQVASIPLADFIVTRDKKAFLDLHKHVISGEKMQLQYEIIGLKGARRWVDTHAVPMSENGVKLVLAVTRDITKQKLAEQQNEILLAEQAAMLDNKLVGIAKVRDRKILWTNIAFELMFGYSHEDLLAMPTRQLYVDEETYQAVSRSYAEIEKHSVVRGQYEFMRKDGKYIWLNLSGAMLNKDQGESIWTFVDVTSQKQAEIASTAAHNLLEIIIDKTPARIFWKDKDLRYLGCNTIFANDAGKASSLDIVGKNDFELSWAAQAELYQADDSAVMASGIAKIGYEEPQTTPQGNTMWCRTSKIPLMNNQNEVFGILGMYEDITERKLAEKELSIAATAFESQEGMMVTDANNVIVKVNQAFSAITGYSSEDAVGQYPSLLSSGRHDADFYKAMWKDIKDTGTWQGGVWNKRKSGEVYPQQLCVTVVKDSLGVVSNYVATLTDITMSKIAAEEIQRLAFYDPLTHLPNRRLLVDRLNQAIVASARNGVGGALLFIDLDHFKTLNDSLGHDIGDLLLQQVAERLISCVREGDTVSRLGGDEFVVMLEHLSTQAIEAAAQAEGVAEKILTALNKPFNLAEHEYHNTASIGIALFNDQSQSQEDLLKHADIAMYQAKKTGRNALCFFDPKMQDAIRARMSLENDLRKALKKKEFQLHYQIQVNGAGQALGAEALIRWIHPTRGLISPYHFIPLAEDTGLILPIGQWVLETACAQLKAWEENPLTHDLTLSINVSAKQFNQSDFVKQVQATLQHYEINPSLLNLELTESIIIDNIDHIIVTMIALQALGVHFELDDFGTGYSSLQYLKQLPLHQLKIDQSFVRDIIEDNSDQAIIRTIIAMAGSLNLEVIAEGVETDNQLAFLINYGCNHFQGYLFGKPVPIEVFEAALKKV